MVDVLLSVINSLSANHAHICHRL